jgi:hypothetical protein
MEKVNLWPVIISTIITFGLSSLWYSSFVFGKTWMKLSSRFSNGDINRGSIVWSYFIHIVFSFISYCFLYFVLSSMNVTSVSESLFIGFLVWFAFMLPTNVSYFLWQRNSFKLLAIDSIINLINILVVSIILVNW